MRNDDHHPRCCRLWVQIPMLATMLAGSVYGNATDLPDTVDRIRPSIVGVGTQEVARRPPDQLRGTGFVVGDGTKVITNVHVVANELNDARKEHLVVFIGRGGTASVRDARIVKQDDTHDLALLDIGTPPLPALRIGSASAAREGQRIAFTGFPIGAILGLYPVTHTGIISAIVPIIIPVQNASTLSATDIRFLRSPYNVFQLDATAYPGNSGSPVYDVQSGEVIGVVNQVFVKGKKEDVLKDPSAISYAMPATFVESLLQGAQ